MISFNIIRRNNSKIKRSGSSVTQLKHCSLQRLYNIIGRKQLKSPPAGLDRRGFAVYIYSDIPIIFTLTIYMKIYIIRFCGILFCEIHCAAFAYNVDLYLARILKLFFDLLYDVSCDNYHLIVVYLFGFYHYADFSARLNGI